MKTAIYRVEHFNAAHRLHNPNWSEKRNKSVFGKCNNANFHGHNYNLIVTVIGEVDPVSGYLIDTKWLSQLIKAEIEDRFDHKNLNIDCPEFKALNPTAENIAVVSYNLLRSKIDKEYDISLKLWETENNIVEYSGK